jgi:hypothetical protein
MIDLQDIIYQAKVSGYYFYYDGNFINVYDEDVVTNKSAQCVLRVKADCSSKKDFEIETVYILNSGSI